MVPSSLGAMAVSAESNIQAQGSIVNNTGTSSSSSSRRNTSGTESSSSNSWITSSMNLLRLGSISKKKQEASSKTIAVDDDSEDGKSMEDSILLNHCRCCGSVLKLPESVVKFKCSICHTKITLIETDKTLSPHQLSNQSADHVPQQEVMSYRSIRRMIRHCEKASDPNPHVTYKPLENYLVRCFSSFEIVNNSFKLIRVDELSFASPNINFDEVTDSYKLIISLPTTRPLLKLLMSAHGLLTKPLKTLSSPADLKWLLVLWEIPTLSHCLYHNKKAVSSLDTPEIKSLSYEIIKRIIGYLANSDSSTLKFVSSWFLNSSNEYFTSKVILINLYITFHLTRLIEKYYNTRNDKLPPYSTTALRISNSPTSPQYSDFNDSVKLNGTSTSNRTNTSTSTSTATISRSYGSQNFNSDTRRSTSSVGGGPFFNLPLTFQNGFSSWTDRNQSSKPINEDKPLDFKLKPHHYGNEWHIKTAARLLSVFYFTNLKSDRLPVYSFYNTLVDYVNVKQDFDLWQTMFKKPSTLSPNDPTRMLLDLSSLTNDRKPSLTLCQFPFLLSLGAKISILEYEARKTMEHKAEQAFINALDKKRIMDVHLRIRVRRTHISNDSLRCIKEHSGDLQKALKVEFIGEPGVDVGGLKKEWFSLLTKELFSQENGMFFYNEESHLCWFASMPLERNDELYFMVGAVLGLAIFNSTILDLRFPLALYKKLLDKKVMLDDYIELFPETGKGLSKLLSTQGDVSDYGLFFETTYKDLFDKPVTEELIPNGSKIQVDNLNRYEYVKKWIDFYMNKSIKSQFESFHKGFHTVVSCNSLSLFAPKEIEMIICGNNETNLDVESFKSITKYTGWKAQEEALESNIVLWFWEWFSRMHQHEHKKFLQFVTGSDRIPATGVHTMQFKITKMPYFGPNTAIKLPVAHTCFNELCLYEYRSKEEMFSKLDWAINESKGFGLR